MMNSHLPPFHRGNAKRNRSSKVVEAAALFAASNVDQMQRNVYNLESQNRRTVLNSAKAYDGKQVWTQRWYEFMWYRAFRCLRKNIKGTRIKRSGFDSTENMSLIQKYGENYGQRNCGSIEDDPLIGINEKLFAF
ncbi:hypothetical protein IV203_032792 [Nitzschia inconspicua]|uniref:Uncharacterized protein n=1 Tax=Nitzschia inconspicua TaxID=303405 RepID=A0A9K3KKZ5_9STRA|nr:hypothetical protein IV203_032792 [Nitzschia inconspicua]